MDQSSSNPQETTLRNAIIAIVAIVLSVVLFLGIQQNSQDYSLDTQAKQATPLDVALTNGKPTLVEFYANWCNSCQAMAEDLGTLKQEFHNQINFVMLNIDNSKWLPEVLKYKVDGIPHFIFIDQAGNSIAQSIGEQPKTVLTANLSALIEQQPLPYVTTQNGEISSFSVPVKPSNEQPRDHS